VYEREREKGTEKREREREREGQSAGEVTMWHGNENAKGFNYSPHIRGAIG